MDVLRRQAVADGMRPLRLAGALRVAEGLTTLEEVLMDARRWTDPGVAAAGLFGTAKHGRRGVRCPQV
jgi:hypothetical protein